MRATVVADYSGFRPYQEGPNAPLFWGMNGMILIEAMVFGSLVSAYFFLRAQSPEWPPGGTEPPKLLLPTINTLVLIASSFVLHWADTGIRKGDKRRLFRGLLAASALAAVFLILKVVEYSEVPYRWDTHAYGSVVWTIVGFHSAHVLSLMLKTVVVATLSSREYFTSERRLGVTINGIYWHFVVAVWIPLYIVLYWVPRI
jgi:cytochrome c oxidase subunit III